MPATVRKLVAAAPSAAPPAAAKPAAPAPAASAAKPAVPPAPKKKEEARIDWDKAIAAATWRPSAKAAAAKKEVGPIGRFDADIPSKKGGRRENVEYLGGPDDAELNKAD